MMIKRILVTRPKDQAHQLVESLEQQGHHPICLPLLKIIPFNETSSLNHVHIIKQQLSQINQYTVIIFISTNAVDGFFYWLNHLSLSIPARQQFLAIGKATQERLRQQGISAETAGLAMNSESLLELAVLKQPENESILIVRGEGGREYLKQVLQHRGARVDYLEVYRRETLQYPLGTLSNLLTGKIDFITLSSGETIQQLLHQAMIEGITDKVLTTPVIVPGDRLYQEAMNQGFSRVFKATNAGIDAILAITNHY